jgi:hypothetical protein
VGFAVHRARTEVALLLTEQVGAVGIEGRPYGRYRLCFCSSLLAKTAGDEEESGKRKEERDYPNPEKALAQYVICYYHTWKEESG